MFIFLAMTTVSGVTIADSNTQEVESQFKTIEISQVFSDPILEKNDENLKIRVNEAPSIISTQGGPILPMLNKKFEFPWGTQIKDIEYEFSNVKSKTISTRIVTMPVFCYTEGIVTKETKNNEELFEGNSVYPTDWYSIKKGVGLNKEGEHVLHLSLNVYPVRCIPSVDVIEYINDIHITVNYEETTTSLFDPDAYDMVIITPSYYVDNLELLVDHKQDHDVKTTIVTLDDIYESYPGRDEPEQIKYFVKHAIEEWSVEYVLLVGDIKDLPIRSSDAYPWDGFGGDILSDLYYADIYDESYSFCSWDSNKNNIFGEVLYDFSKWPPNAIDLDGVDLYPDVHIGRIACRDQSEVDLVVDKIIYYEELTYDGLWFNKIILAGGDTFPPGSGSLPFVYEGEITNRKVMQQIPDFEHVTLWASKRNLNAFTFNRAISRGAGFVTYAGHGFEHGWGTYRPNALRRKMGLTNPVYFTPFIQGVRNGYKLPVMFWDACLTAKLDFNMSTFDNYYPKITKLIRLLTGVDYDPTDYFVSFAWAWLIKENGGAIATIGATRPAYSAVDQDGVYAGAGKLDVLFFESYEKGITLGEMFTEAQVKYIDRVQLWGPKDYFTIEEYMILGDPSLKLGGYP